ncbi:MAG: hypothetical protein UU48_C0011G0013 [Candidatus Uhrbacteria bacterium GW2011_GWF2_41_16]|uniref:Uncharacterized protein n=2 Tax=Candidatus Uhriibacteriota TaxID=1752732 RepID=A0A0G0VDA6_9BACT|nr:MAG: hypothetical protein UU31_C0004G0012 [Candidatus Uhrbacteria bacterium GW2011_GWA2_41_10]KKR87057.1 MAG: hypothetical protein UU35_C0006G0010 [Candidatus Uhrbacteria bacterium GW2011_GWC2_41_11]KKR97621.1 MAG: hypothetical protein UU48_C0011G0013 [Candidatus Uhrbacteria bacterium GW2011_GWF2_41_16]HBP00447.1 hypothetical protein [Candidatus Uhrbacteria bacterium]
MWFLRDHYSPSEMLARTLFLSSLVSFVGFFLLDFFLPGFVSRFFSPNLFLFPVFMSGIWWAMAIRHTKNHRNWQMILSLFASLIATIVAWNMRNDFGEYVFFALLLAFVTPVVAVLVIWSSNEEGY